MSQATNGQDLEFRDPEERAADWAQLLPAIVARAQAAPGHAERLGGIDPARVTDRAALATLPVLRKTDLAAAQSDAPPFGGLTQVPATGFAHMFQSPGNIYEPGQRDHDWWRMARFLRAAGIGAGDIVQNCFSYHMTPAGMIFENGAAAVGASVFPAGTGQTDQQVEAARHLGVTAYAGTPDYLKVILDRADELGIALPQLKTAVVGGGPLFPSLRQYYADRGIACLQCYATADVGAIAYESPAMEGMIIDDGVLIEIVTPGTGDPVAEGEVGEILVTSANPDYPLVRFATGDLSAVLPGQSPCGRTNMRIKGWMGRADQTVKVKGMFVRPEQVAAIRARLGISGKARFIVSRDAEQDVLTFEAETDAHDADALAAIVREVTKLRATAVPVAPDSLPADGIVIQDTRDFDA